MKKWLPLLNFSFTKCLIATLLGMGLSATLYSQEVSHPLTFRADYYFPFNSEPKDRNPGYVVEILKRVYGAKNIDYELVPWKEAVNSCTEGKIDGIIGAIKTDAPDCIYPEEPIGYSQIIIVSKLKKQWRYIGPKSLVKQKLGYIAGYSYGKTIDDHIAANKYDQNMVFQISSTRPEIDALKLLAANKIDVYVTDPTIFGSNLTIMGQSIEDYYVSPQLTEPLPLYVAFSPKLPNAKSLANQLSDGIQKLRKSGELKKILDVYGVKDWKAK